MSGTFFLLARASRSPMDIFAHSDFDGFDDLAERGFLYRDFTWRVGVPEFGFGPRFCEKSARISLPLICVLLLLVFAQIKILSPLISYSLRFDQMIVFPGPRGPS
jgi:hypothetical protein